MIVIGLFVGDVMFVSLNKFSCEGRMSSQLHWNLKKGCEDREPETQRWVITLSDELHIDGEYGDFRPLREQMNNK